ncbi:MAG TPA: O-antigen ligase family protein [Pirellulales bacterium]|jgi:O-antigen ligase
MIDLILILAVAGSIWGGILLVRGSLHAGCLAYLLSAACFGFYFASFHVGPLPLTIDRVVMVVLALAFVLQWRLGRVPLKPIDTGDMLAFSLLGLFMVSFAMSIGESSSKQLLVSAYRLLGGYAMPIAVYWIGRQAPLSEATSRRIQIALGAFGIYLAVMAVLEVTAQWGLVFPKHIADPKLGIHFGRARGPMLQSVSMGLTLGICLLSAVVVGIRSSRPGQLLLMLLLPVYALGIYLTYTRSVWIGVGLGLMTVLGLLLPVAWRKWVLAGAATAGLVVGASKFEQILAFEREFSAAGTKESAEARVSFVYVSWMMFLDHPLLGSGFGTFEEGKLPYLDDRETDLKLQTIRTWSHHNTLLSILTETGIVGLSLFLTMLGWFARQGWRLYRDPRSPSWARAQGALLLGALPIYCVQAVFHELSYTPIDNSLLFYIAGMTCGLVAPAAATALQRQPVAIKAHPAY